MTKDNNFEKDATLLSIIHASVATLPKPPHSIIMRMEIGDRTGAHDLYLEDTDGKILHFFGSASEKIWDHFYEWRKPTRNAPDKWNLAVLRWSPDHGISVEYGQTDVKDISGFSTRRAAWQKQEFGDKEIPFFVEPRTKKSEGSVAELSDVRLELNDVTSFEKAEHLSNKGQLVRVLLIPAEFNGSDSDVNTVYLPKAVSKAKDQVTNSLLKLERDGQITSLDVRLVYKGNSVVPSEIIMKSWHKEKSGEFINTIKVW
jgi:hypothetical protein